MTELQVATPEDARRLTDRIKVAVEATWELIQEAYLTRAWSALGYTTWDEYCTREFGTSRLRLPREERQEVVASLRESGLSVRAISAATGVSVGTVAGELRCSEMNTLQVKGTDGKSYAPSRPVPRPAIRETYRPPRDEPAEKSGRPEPEPNIWYGGPAEPEPEPIPAPMCSSAPLPMTEEEREERLRLVAKQEALNAWNQASDGLTTALSYAKTYTPPEDTDIYASVDDFTRRLKELTAIADTWKDIP